MILYNYLFFINVALAIIYEKYCEYSKSFCKKNVGNKQNSALNLCKIFAFFMI